jgi:hypothetical protein
MCSIGFAVALTVPDPEWQLAQAEFVPTKTPPVWQSLQETLE